MIIKSCRSLIISQGFPELSLRKVAKKSGIGLSTLQHHFNSKETLVRAVLHDTKDLFKKKCQELKSQNINDPISQIRMVSEWLINDLKNKDTSHLFTQLWAYSFMDDFTLTVMDEIYKEYCDFFLEMITKIHPKINHKQAMVTSIKIVAIIEGLTIFIGSKPKSFLRKEFDIETSTVESILEMVLIHN
ncbi:MAG: TetR/AcrR family transcriptional regulator [Proteobacteria bacterium]|nr:TetR/AcrR family transcriptional regulator [Pseudomonadota bacterium]